MSGQPPTPGPSTPTAKLNPTTTPRPTAINNLAKKSNASDVTRQGNPKLTFLPKLPLRRKKDGDTKPEHNVPASGNDKGDGAGRGRTSAAAVPSTSAALQMTASGPFAFGPPGMSSSSTKRNTLRTQVAPVAPKGAAPPSTIAPGPPLPQLSTLRPQVKKEPEGREEVEREAYSDPDDGVEIIDMEDVKHMDWMAPDSLLKDRNEGKKRRTKKVAEMKVDISKPQDKGKGKEPERPVEEEIINLANALDLSESEEEEELENLIDDFAQATDQPEKSNTRQGQLYLFQFPRPFPTFLPKPSSGSVPTPEPMLVDDPPPSTRRVPFASDLKSSGPELTPGPALATGATPLDAPAPEAQPRVNGIIGQLEVYRSGTVKMRLGDDIVLDVTAATQPSFLQQAVHLDLQNKRLCVLGEVNKCFVASPDIEALLNAVEAADRHAMGGDDGLFTISPPPEEEL